jgi:hypothetical protein
VNTPWTLPTVLSLSAAAASLSVATLAFVIAIKNYRRKAGILVRGNFSIGSARASNDEYVTEIILENLKDRAVTIFAIYLKLGFNYYVELENLEQTPLILKPFETYRKQFGPLEFYSVNTNKINLNRVFASKKAKRRLVLSTSDGKYQVSSSLRRWNPVEEYFRNQCTAIIRPVQSLYRDTHLGGNIAYVIEILREEGDDEIIPIHPKDYEVKIFRNFSLSKEALSSKQSLEEFLKAKIDEGKLPCKGFKVHDLAEWRKIAHEFYANGRTVDAKYLGPFAYYVLGRIFTRYSSWKVSRENKKRQASSKRAATLTPKATKVSSEDRTTQQD